MSAMISVTILTKNNQKHIREVLEAVKDFEEVLIYDNGSEDETLSIAKEFKNVNIVEGPFLGFGPMHNKAVSLTKNEWVLSIDSDEIVTKELLQEIKQLKLDPHSVYSFPRNNYYNGKHIRCCGWYPDRQYRLFHKMHTRFTDAQVHEQVILSGMRHVPLKNPIIHYSYDNVSDFIIKMQHYSDLFATQNQGKKRSSPCKAVLHALFTFFKCYFLKRGIFYGYEGFLISSYNAHTAFYKYLKLYEYNLKD